MPILDLQVRMRELGRIRIGQKGAEGQPQKLDRFRFTSASRPLIEAVAGLYGGIVADWTPSGGSPQFEVVTDSKRIPVLVPPQPLTQFYELWSGGGCQRRCDGQRELLTDVPCICSAVGQEGADRECKPTTRLNVIVRDLPGVGMFRLESHGFYAATELPQLASFLAQASGSGTYLPAFLGLEERTVKRNGQRIKKFIVPTLDIEVTPAALMAGGGGLTPPNAIEAQARPAIEAGSPADPRPLAQQLASNVRDATTVPELEAIQREAEEAGVWVRGLADAVAQRRKEIGAANGTGDPDAAWAEIMRLAPEDWTTSQLEAAFTAQVGVAPHAASADELANFLSVMQENR